MVALGALTYGVIKGGGLFRPQVVAVSLGSGFMLNAAYYGGVFVFSLYLQQERGQSTLHTGLMFIPMTALVAVVNLASAKLSSLFGPHVPMVAGQLVLAGMRWSMLIAAAGLLLTALVTLTLPGGRRREAQT